MIDNNILITIGISFFNADKYLAFAIQSVLKQTYPNWELFLVDDGSTDQSIDIANSFTDSRIKVMSDGVNRGLVTRLNELMMMANGAYIVRMDADDIMFSDRLEKQLNVFKNNPSIDVLHGDAVSITNSNAILGYKKSSSQKTKSDILKGMMPINPTVMARSNFFKNNKYDDAFCRMEDLELWYRTIDDHIFFNLNEPCLFYREDSTLISKKHFKMIDGKSEFAKKYNFSILDALKLVNSSRIKGVIYFVLEKLNLQNVLIAKRYSEISPIQKNIYHTLLKEIIN